MRATEERKRSLKGGGCKDWLEVELFWGGRGLVKGLRQTLGLWFPSEKARWKNGETLERKMGEGEKCYPYRLDDYLGMICWSLQRGEKGGDEE